MALAPIGINNPQDLATAMKFGPQTAQALQHSSYLSAALQQLNGEGSQNIHSGAELGAKLLAEALLSRGYSKAQAATMAALQGDQAAQLQAAVANTPLDPSAAPSPPPQQAPPAPSPPPQAVGPAPPQAGPPLDNTPPPGPQAAQDGAPPAVDPNLPRGLRNNNPLNLQATVPWHNMTGSDGRYAQFASMQDGLNAADHNLQAYANHHGINTVAGIVNRWAPSSDNGPATANYTGFVAGQLGVDPNQPLDMKNPAVRQQLIGAMGHFENGRPIQMAQSAAPPGPPPPPDPNGPPVQSVGQPPAPQPPPLTGGASGDQLASQAPPQSVSPPQGIPHQVVTPEEWKTAFAMAQDWHTRDIGLAEIAKLKMRAASSLEAPKNMMWSAQAGRYVPMPGTETTQLPSQAPADAAQRDAFGNITHSEVHGVQGSVPEGKQYDRATQSYVPIAGGQAAPMTAAQRQQWGISPQDRNTYAFDASGKPMQVAAAPFSVKDVADTMKDLTASPQYDKATKLTEMYRGAVQASQRAGGISDAELKDNAAQIFSGGVARQFNSRMIDEGQGPWLRLKQIVPELASGQKISPQGRQAILQAMHDYVGEAQGAFGSLAASKSAFAAQQGIDLSPFVSPLMRGIPDVPGLDTIPNGASGYPSEQSPAAPTQPSYAAIQAEIARRKAAGTWTGR